MSAGAQPTVVANDAAAPGGSEALPTADECAFGREYCRRYRKRRLQGFDDGLLLAGELQRGTDAVLKHIQKKNFNANNPIVLAFRSAVANGCTKCHTNCYKEWNKDKTGHGAWDPSTWITPVSGSSNSGDSSSNNGASSDGGSACAERKLQAGSSAAK